MDQTTARRLARQVDGVATQDSRYHGRWAKPGEPWIVVFEGGVLRTLPDEGASVMERAGERL